MAVEAVRDLRSRRAVASPEELEQFETDVLAGLVLARASAGLADGTIRGDVSNLEQVRDWFGRPLWEMQPADADAYFGTVLRGAPSGTRLARAAALSVYFEFLELRHKVELHAMTGRVVECPIDEMNRPRGSKDARLRIPPPRAEIEAPVRRVAAGNWPPAASSPRQRGTTRRPGCWPRSGCGSTRPAISTWPTCMGAGPVREAARPHRQGRPRFRAAGADGAAAQRRRAHVALVHRGRVGPLRRRPHPPGRPAVPVRARRARRVGPARRRRRAAGRARARHGGAPAGLGGPAVPTCCATTAPRSSTSTGST